MQGSGARALVLFIANMCLHDVDLLEVISLASGNPNGFSLVVKKTLQRILTEFSKQTG